MSSQNKERLIQMAARTFKKVDVNKPRISPAQISRSLKFCEFLYRMTVNQMITSESFLRDDQKMLTVL